MKYYSDTYFNEILLFAITRDGIVYENTISIYRKILWL